MIVIYNLRGSKHHYSLYVGSGMWVRRDGAVVRYDPDGVKVLLGGELKPDAWADILIVGSKGVRIWRLYVGDVWVL